MMKKTLAIVFFWLCGLLMVAQETSFQTPDLQLTVDDHGTITALSVCGKKALSNNCPVLLACRDGEVLSPTRFKALTDQAFDVKFDDYGDVVLQLKIIDNYLKFSIIEQSDFDAVVLFPIRVTLTGSVGEIIGVAQGNGIAFGMQALTPKTEAGLPSEYAETVMQQLNYQGEPTWAAVPTEKGTMMQFSARDRSQKQHRNVQGIDEVMVLPIHGEEANIEGASIALFGCRDNKVLERIGAIEEAEGLPHPMTLGVWDKTSPLSTRSYLICEADKKSADYVDIKCRQAGLDLGQPVLANRIAINSRLVTPTPSKQLLRQGVLRLHMGIAADQTHFAVYNSPLFDRPANINVIQIGNELISYRSSEVSGDIRLLYHCTRGAFGTRKTAHSKDETVYKLWDHLDRTLVPILATQDSMCLSISRRLAKTPYPLLVFNDLKSYAYNGHGDLAIAHLLGAMHQYNEEKRMQADTFSHYAWHYLTRVNDNTVWNASMRTKMAEDLPKRQDFYHRNMMPWLLGNFQIHLADKNRKATSMEELEWFLSKAAAFDAGFGLDFSVEAMRKHGLTNIMLTTIRTWETLRLSHAFNDKTKEALKDPYCDWHIKRDEDSTFLLYPQHNSRRYFCNLTDDQWEWNSPYTSRFALCITVEGKGSISNPVLMTPNGMLSFPCSIRAGQYLIYDFEGNACITDFNYNKIADVTAEGESFLDEGTSTVSFGCEVTMEERKKPEVNIRYYTHGEAKTIKKGA